MSERLVVDSIMTADGEVVPLGPVDKDGHRVPLDTTDLYGPRGEHYKVKSFVHFPLMDGWFMECAFTHDLIDVSSLRLKAPDSWGLLNEIAEDAHGVLNAIEGKEADKVDDEEVLCFCHDLAVVMTTLETVAMIGRLVPWFLGDKGCEGE